MTTTPQDRSLDIGVRLDSAKAILDLLFIVNGSRLDYSDSKFDQLDRSTVSSALHCARQNIVEAEAMRDQQTQYERALDAV